MSILMLTLTSGSSGEVNLAQIQGVQVHGIIHVAAFHNPRFHDISQDMICVFRSYRLVAPECLYIRPDLDDGAFICQFASDLYKPGLLGFLWQAEISDAG